MGFDRVFAPGTRVDAALAALAQDFRRRDAARFGAEPARGP
jgi:methylmalonyl-CoA mutase cobalamin-binding subunit